MSNYHCQYRLSKAMGKRITQPGLNAQLSWYYVLFSFIITVWKLEKEQSEHINPIGWRQKGLADWVLPLFQLPFIVWQHFLLLCARKTQASWLLPNVLPLLYSLKLHTDVEKSHKHPPTQPHTHTLCPVGRVPLTTNQITEESSCLDTANKVLSRVDKNWCWTTQNQTSGQRSSTRKGSGSLKSLETVIGTGKFFFFLFHLGNLLALDITNRQCSQTH